MPRINVFRSRFFWKIYATFALLFLSVTVLVSWIASYKIRSNVHALEIESLKAKAEFLSPHARDALLGTVSIADLANLDQTSSTRVTTSSIGVVTPSTDVVPASPAGVKAA